MSSFKIPSEHDSVSFYVSSTHVTFDNTVDDMLFIGWNCRYVNEAPLVKGEPAFFEAFETNYDSGDDHYMEWYIQYVDGNGENARRPYQASIDRGNHTSILQMIGTVYVYNSEHTELNVTYPEAGGMFLHKGTFVHVPPGGNPWLQQRNNANTAYQSLLYLDEHDRARVPSLLSTATTVDTHTAEFVAIPDQTSDLFKISQVGGGVLCRFNKDGYFMTTKTCEPEDDDVSASECAFWFDDTAKDGKLMIKGKTSDGAVVSGEVSLS